MKKRPTSAVPSVESLPDSELQKRLAAALGDPEPKRAKLDCCDLAALQQQLDVQAAKLEQLLQERGGELSRVLLLDADSEVLLARLTGRLLCLQCTRTFHKVFRPPQRPGLCDGCGGELSRRKDDSKEVQRERLDTYRHLTKPLEGFYRDRGVLEIIDGSGSVEDVAGLIDRSLSGN